MRVIGWEKFLLELALAAIFYRLKPLSDVLPAVLVLYSVMLIQNKRVSF